MVRVKDMDNLLCQELRRTSLVYMGLHKFIPTKSSELRSKKELIIKKTVAVSCIFQSICLKSCKNDEG